MIYSLHYILMQQTLFMVLSQGIVFQFSKLKLKGEAHQQTANIENVNNASL